MTDYATILDVGPSQGLPDWDRVASSRIPHVNGVFLKATEGASGSGSSVPTFAQNAAGLVAAGLPFGCYHFLSPFSAPEAQAEHFIATIKGSGHTLPPMVDVERSVGQHGVFPTVDCLLDFLAAVESALDVVPVIYTADWVAVPMGLSKHPELRRHPLWVPSYTQSDPPLCPPWGAWGDPSGNVLGWQFTSKGAVPGVEGGVDLSRFKTMPTWDCATNDPPPATTPTGTSPA